MPLTTAVAATRIHHQLLPVNTLYEEPYATLDTDTAATLKSRGYVIENQGWNGDVEAIEIHGEQVVAVPDPRGRGVGRVLP